MTLISKDDIRDLVILFSVPSAGILFYFVHKYATWAADSDLRLSCGRGQSEGGPCGPEFVETAADLLEIWAISVSVTVLPLLVMVTVLVILVRWVRSFGEPAEN